MNSLNFLDEAIEEIKSMKVRGAGKIARFAVETLGKVVEASNAKTPNELFMELREASKKLLSSRPTAVSLPNGVRFVMHKANLLLKENPSIEEFKNRISIIVKEFINKSEGALDKIAIFGSKRIEDGETIMTHCNSAAVIAILRKAYDEGKKIKVYVTETRPLYQGRITAKQLGKIGIKTILIIDSAARYFMNDVDKVLVGADAIAVNGAVINKIGTSMIALAAYEARTQFLVAAETYKFSPETMIGELIQIEERNREEVISNEELKEILNCEVRNPAFDVTPPEYIDAIITEEGIIPPQAAFYILQKSFGELTPEELAEYKAYKPIEEF
ncbi:MAG: ribose 1,5-bisphosphate isomerase [Candidatus Bathyarchaeia archaeon]|nr:ribose 1,5-bisphosphate isomerase [Candidatus Bathyarchaeota archaeon]